MKVKPDLFDPSIANYTNIPEQLITQIGLEATSFIEKYIDCTKDDNVLWSTSSLFDIENTGRSKNIVNTKRINDSRYINKFLESVNTKLEKGGLYISCVETYPLRKKRLLEKYRYPLNIIYHTMDSFYSRVGPKVALFNKAYFFFGKGHNRALSKAETFGRLYSCGFEVIDEENIANMLFFVSKKVKSPVFDGNPSYGALIRLPRVGKRGNIFNVFKLRTMYAYSEYLQEYVHERNNLDEGGKFKNDFRITSEGRLFRKYWIDELPMIFNLLRGDMKLVGVRPLSRQYFALYNKKLQEERILHKPGLVPPFYADRPKSLDDIMKSEMKYLLAYNERPLLTDIKYFFSAFYNIIFKGARSS